MMAKREQKAEAQRRQDATRDWFRRLQELSAQYRACIPPMPDPAQQPREYNEWAQNHAVNSLAEMPTEWQQLFADTRKLPKPKWALNASGEPEVWEWLTYLQARQSWGAPYDLRTCSLGSNPCEDTTRKTSRKGRPKTEQLSYLVDILARQFPEIDVSTPDARRLFALKLYDAIRKWRKFVSTI